MSPSLPHAVDWVEFEGPLDLLLEEVRRQSVDVERIQMAPLVARFLDYVRTARQRDLNLDIEWLHTASVLIQWKSRSLLPHEPTAEPVTDNIRDELIDQLRRHRKEAAEALASRFSRAAAQLPRGSREQFTRETGPDNPEDWPFLSVWDLLQQARQLARWAVGYREHQQQWQKPLAIEQQSVTVEEMSQLLRASLAATESGVLEATTLLAEQPTPARRACLFLGLLEMTRAQEVAVSQERAWGEIWMTKILLDNLATTAAWRELKPDRYQKPSDCHIRRQNEFMALIGSTET